MTKPFLKGLSAFRLFLGQPSSSLASLLLLSPAAAGSVPSATSADVPVPLGLPAISDRSFPPQHMVCVSSLGSGQPLGCSYCQGDEWCSGQALWHSPSAAPSSSLLLLLPFLTAPVPTPLPGRQSHPGMCSVLGMVKTSLSVSEISLESLGTSGWMGPLEFSSFISIPGRFSCKIREVAQGFLQPGFENIHLQANREQQCCCLWAWG